MVLGSSRHDPFGGKPEHAANKHGAKQKHECLLLRPLHLWSPVASVSMSNNIAKGCFAVAFERWANHCLDWHRARSENMLIRGLSFDLSGSEHGDTGSEDEDSSGEQGRPRPAIELGPPAEIHLGDAGHDARLELVPVRLTDRRGVERAEAARHVVIVVVHRELRSHISLRTSLSSRRNVARAWCRSDRAVPSGIPSIAPISPDRKRPR